MLVKDNSFTKSLKICYYKMYCKWSNFHFSGQSLRACFYDGNNHSTKIRHSVSTTQVPWKLQGQFAQTRSMHDGFLGFL